MDHLTQIKGDEFQGFWFECKCGKEGQVYDEKVAAEMEASVHETTALL